MEGVGLVQLGRVRGAPGADLAIRYGMYRTAGFGGETAGAGIVLSWFFTTGYKLVVPIIALAWIVIAEGIDDTPS